MRRALKRNEPGPGGMLVWSFLLHAALFFLVTQLNILSGVQPDNAPVYYVDVVNLPVARPRSGNPAGSTAGATEPAPPPAAPKPQPEEMRLPAKTTPPSRPKTATAAPSVKAKQDRQETTQDFEERLARLQQETESRHESAALDALRRRAAGRGKGQAGMPGAAGKEAGSDYSSYIQSRLKDAFKSTITFQSRTPEVRVRLTIDRAGHIVRQRIEYSSGDRLFEGAVLQAIAKAEKSFTPPPGGQDFEHGFVFKPQGVGKN